MSSTPELIVTDCGSAFINFDTRAGATDLGIHIDAGPAGMPELRSRIERMFGTMSTGFISRFTGRAFSNTIQKGDYDAEGRAALTAEDLSEALVRWVVDVYHRTPHAGLGGETPASCWNRQVDRGVRCPVAEDAGRDQGKRPKPPLIDTFSPGKHGLIVSHREHGDQVFADIRLAYSGRGFEKGKALFVDGAGGLIDQLGLKGLRFSSGVRGARHDPRGEAGHLDDGPGT